MDSLRALSLRWVLALAIALGVCVVSAAAAAPVHGHTGFNSDACALCQFSHLPFAADAAAPEIWPPLDLVVEASPIYTFSPCTQAVGLAGGRAPPQA